MKKAVIASFIAFLIFPVYVFSRIGVGVGTGKIQVDEKLKPGSIYELPPLTVLNTGDQASDYEVEATYHEKQPEIRPDQSWFRFSPQKFYLEPGEVQKVDITLDLPIRIEPGDYFAYLEGHPQKKSEQGSASIGVAAAAKLYFTVVPGNFIEGIYYKLLSLWRIYDPWPQRALTVGVFIGILLLFKKFFNIQVDLKKRSSRKKISEKESEKLD